MRTFKHHLRSWIATEKQEQDMFEVKNNLGERLESIALMYLTESTDWLEVEEMDAAELWYKSKYPNIYDKSPAVATESITNLRDFTTELRTENEGLRAQLQNLESHVNAQAAKKWTDGHMVRFAHWLDEGGRGGTYIDLLDKFKNDVAVGSAPGIPKDERIFVKLLDGGKEKKAWCFGLEGQVFEVVSFDTEYYYLDAEYPRRFICKEKGEIVPNPYPQ